MRDRKGSLNAPAAKSAQPLAGAALVLFLATGCASIPPGKTAADWIGALPSDSTYYLCLNTGRTRDLVMSVLKKTPLAGPDIEQLMGFTQWIYCGVKTAAGEKPAFALVLLGDYPFAIRSVLEASPELEEMKGDPPAWRHKKLGLEIALPFDFMVVAANTNAVGLARAARASGPSGLSADAVREIAASDFTLYFPLGWDDLINSETGLTMPKKIFREVWLSARFADGRYYFAGMFTVGPDVDAQSFKKLLQFFMLALFRKNEVRGLGARLAAVQFSVEDRMIKAEGFYFTPEELEPLIAGLLAKGL